MRKTRINVELLKLVRKEIRREPLRIYMGVWLCTFDKFAPCHTTGCIAGLAVLIHALRSHSTEAPTRKKAFRVEASARAGEDVASEATRILNLTEAEADRLFYSSSWPSKYYNQYIAADQTKGRRAARIAMANVASCRINHFIKTGGRE